MAVNDYNSVPLGQAGTGEAFVLGQSQAANQFVQNQARNQQIAYQNQLAKQKAALEKAALWDKNALKVAGGTYWKSEFDKRAQDHIQKGIQLRQQGINPFSVDYNNPKAVQASEDYLLERQGIERDVANRKATEAEVAKRFSAITANPRKFEPEDIDALNTYINTPYSQAKDMPIPTLRGAFNPLTDLVPKLDAVTFQKSGVVGNQKIDEKRVLEEPTKQNIQSLIGSTPEGERWIKRNTGLTISEAKNIPNTFEDNKKDLYKEYNGNPRMREAIARQYGITGDGMELDTLFNQQAQDNVAKKEAFNSIINQYTDLARAKANEFVKTNPDFSLSREARSQRAEQRSIASEQRAKTRFNERNDVKGSNDELYRQKLVEGLLKGEAGTGEAVNEIVMGKGGFSKGLGVDATKAGKLTITVPERITEKVVEDKNGNEVITSVVAPQRTITFDRNKAEDKLKMNQLLNDLTGEKITPSKFITGNASGKTSKSTTQPASQKKTTVPKSVTTKFKGVPTGGF